MKIWTSEHVFNHNWETVTKSQWQKYPNPHNTSVLGTDVVERRVEPSTGALHTKRLIQSDWNLASWVQRLIGANKVCYAREYSVIDPKQKTMTMDSVNLTFCNFVSMHEKMSYSPHPEDPKNKTLLKQETVVTVQGVPLTSYMESIIVNTVDGNAGKGRIAIEWVTEKLAAETKNLSESVDKIKAEVVEMKHTVEDKVISRAVREFDKLQRDLKRHEARIRRTSYRLTNESTASATAQSDSMTNNL